MSSAYLTILRQVLLFVGGVLVTRGLLTEKDSLEIVDAAMIFIGAGITIGTALWRLKERKVNQEKVAAVVNTALALPQGSTPDDLDNARFDLRTGSTQMGFGFGGLQDILLQQAVSTVLALVRGKYPKGSEKYLAPLRAELCAGKTPPQM